LLGKEGEGFRYMLQLMNDARLGVSFQGLGMMEAMYRLAEEYASQRHAWGRPIAQHELIAEKLLDIEVEIKALRSLCYQAAHSRAIATAGENYLKHNPKRSDDEKAEIQKTVARHQKRLRNWTPLLKWWVGVKSVETARDVVQIHGGYGFTKEYRAEWWVRESLILGLYEGTSQIQSLMCVKDTMKEIIRQPREFIENALGTRLQTIAQTDPLKKKLGRMKQVFYGAVINVLFKLVKENVRTSFSELKSTDIMKVVKILSRELVKFENLSPALLHAERICELKAYLSLGRAVVADAEVDPSRKWIAERFVNKALPRMQYLKSLIELDEPVMLARLQSFEGQKQQLG
jgi:hypothetical protein